MILQCFLGKLGRRCSKETRSVRWYRTNGDQWRDAVATATTGGISHSVASTIPKMGRNGGVRVGQYATKTRTYTSDDVTMFGALIADFNPLHSTSGDLEQWLEEDETNASVTGNRDHTEGDENLLELQRVALENAGLIQYQNNGKDDATHTTTKAVVHGIFVSGIFSSIFASIAPGCVYVNQDLDFRAPVFVEDTVVGCIHIKRIRDWRRRQRGGIVVECDTRVYRLISSTNAPCELHPTDAQLAVNGSANVWLPIGYPADN